MLQYWVVTSTQSSPILCSKNNKVNHRRDSFYTNFHPFDHGSLILNLNSQKHDGGPGSFKLDPYLISTGALDNTTKKSIYEANLYTTGTDKKFRKIEKINYSKMKPLKK